MWGASESGFGRSRSSLRQPPTCRLRRLSRAHKRVARRSLTKLHRISGYLLSKLISSGTSRHWHCGSRCCGSSTAIQARAFCPDVTSVSPILADNNERSDHCLSSFSSLPGFRGGDWALAELGTGGFARRCAPRRRSEPEGRKQAPHPGLLPKGCARGGLGSKALDAAINISLSELLTCA